MAEEPKLIWTRRQQDALDALIKQREDAFAAHATVLHNLICASKLENPGAENCFNILIQNAEQFRDALKPFDGREMK